MHCVTLLKRIYHVLPIVRLLLSLFVEMQFVKSMKIHFPALIVPMLLVQMDFAPTQRIKYCALLTALLQEFVAISFVR